MKTSIYTQTALLALGLSCATLAAASGQKAPAPTPPEGGPRPITQTDVDGVYSDDLNHNPNAPFWLTPGLYEVDGIDGSGARKYMMVDAAANNADQYLVVLFDKRAYDSEESVTGNMFQGRRIKNGTIVMLSPLVIDNFGNLQVASEMRRDAAVVELSVQPGRSAFPILMVGRNGALGGQHLGAKVSTRRKPELKPFPSAGVFASGDSYAPDIIVRGSEIAIADGLGDSNFRIVPINGSVGKFAGLVSSRLDTMAEIEASKEDLSALAVFISGVFGNEVMLHAKPTSREGEFRMRFYKRAKPSVLEQLFPGQAYR